MSKEKVFQQINSAMRKVPGVRVSKRAIPRCCKECEYYQPKWKYRSCYFANCRYQLSESTIRKVPLTDDPFLVKEVVSMDGL